MLAETIFLLGFGVFAAAVVVGMIIWISNDSPEEPTEEIKEYDVCEEHGHDLREWKGDGIESSFKPILPRYAVHYGIIADVVPGQLIGLQQLTEKEVAPCRDCDYEKRRKEAVEKQIVFAKDGELKTIDYSQYESLAEEM